MRLKNLRMALAACAISMGTASAAHAQACTVYFSGSNLGTVQYNTQITVIGPYTTSCTGAHTGTVRPLSSASIGGRIERLQGGSWVNVGGLSMSALGQPPGQYRYIVYSTLGSGSFRLDWSHP